MERREFIKITGVGTLAFSTAAFNTSCAVPSWVVTAEGIASVGVNIAAGVIDIVDPVLAPLVDAVKGGFNAVLKALQDYQAALATDPNPITLLEAVKVAFATLQADAAALLQQFNSQGGVLNATIASIIALIAQAVANIGNLIPAQLKAGLKASNLFPPANDWAKGDFKARYNDIVKKSDNKKLHKI
jgi:hypothetical protein